MPFKRIAVIIAVAIAAVFLFFAGSYIAFTVERMHDFARQKERVALLETAGGAQAGAVLPDAGIDDALPFDRLRVIGTHNSYRERSGAFRGFFIELFKRGETAKLAYGHPPLTDQLEAGIRSFELDVRSSARGFECSHVPIVDDRSSTPDFSLGLREIALWSARRPDHVPIVLLLELKDDYKFLDPALKETGAAELDALDGTLRSAFGSRLFVPDDLRGSAETPGEAVRARGWPTVGSLRGRVIAVLHHNDRYRAMYLRNHEGLAGRAMFTSAGPADGAGDGNDVFAVLNEPIGMSGLVSAALSRGMIVRTRADADGTRDVSIRDAAIRSRAQIVSTDYPPAYPAEDGFFVSFDFGSPLSRIPVYDETESSSESISALSLSLPALTSRNSPRSFFASSFDPRSEVASAAIPEK